MVFSSYKKLRIVFFYRKGLKAPAIGKRLLEEGMVASRQGIHDFLKRYAATGSISRKQGSGRKCKVTEAIKAIVEKQVRKDDDPFSPRGTIYPYAPFFAADNNLAGHSAVVGSRTATTCSRTVDKKLLIRCTI